MRRRLVASSVLATLTTLLLVGVAVAGQPLTEVRNDRFAFSFVDDEICPGLEILSAFEGKRTRTIYYDQIGAEKQLVIHVQGWGVFTNVDQPNLSVRSMFSRNIVFDYADHTYTDTGVYRNVTNRGNVLQQTGRWVETLDFDGTILSVSGPHQEWLGDVGDFCAALGG